MTPSDTLLAAARRGDRAAFAQLYEQLYPSVYRYAYFHTRSVAEAEDAASAAFLSALEHLQQFHGAAAQLGGWIIRITHNAIIDRARKAKPQVALEDAPDPTVPDRAPDAIDRVVLRAALATLGEEQRSAVILRFVHGLSSKETAKVLGKSEGAVEQLQRRGLAVLAKELGRPAE